MGILMLGTLPDTTQIPVNGYFDFGSAVSRCGVWCRLVRAYWPVSWNT